MRLIVLVSILGVVASTAHALPRKGRSSHEHCGDRFDSRSSQEWKGVVVELAREQEHRGQEAVHLRVQVDGERVAVRVGPGAVLAEAAFELKERDEITFSGPRVRCNGETVVLATTISARGKTLALRDAAGVPLWAKKRKVAGQPRKSVKAPVPVMRTSKRPAGAS